MKSAGENAARDWATRQGAAADDTEWNDRIGNAHQMLSKMKTAAAKEQGDLKAPEEASLAGKEDADGNVRIHVSAEDTEWNDLIGNAHQMLSSMKTALAAEKQADLQAAEEASQTGTEEASLLADTDLTEGEEDEEGDSVPAPHNSYNTSDAPAELALTVAQGDSVGPLGQNRGERIRGEFGPVTEGSARKPIGREQQQLTARPSARGRATGAGATPR